MMINDSSPDAKRPHTVAGGVAGPGGDIREQGRVQMLSAPPQAAAVTGGRGYAGAKKPLFLPESSCGTYWTGRTDMGKVSDIASRRVFVIRSITRLRRTYSARKRETRTSPRNAWRPL